VGSIKLQPLISSKSLDQNFDNLPRQATKIYIYIYIYSQGKTQDCQPAVVTL